MTDEDHHVTSTPRPRTEPMPSRSASADPGDDDLRRGLPPALDLSIERVDRRLLDVDWSPSAACTDTLTGPDALQSPLEIAVALTDLDGRYLVTNRGWDALCADSSEAPDATPVTGEDARRIHDHHPRLLPSDWLEIWSQATRSDGDDRVRDAVVDLPDGARHRVRWSAAPFRDDRNRIRGVMLALIDATACHDCVDRLRITEARFRAFANAAFDVVYCMSPDWSETRFVHGRDFVVDRLEPCRDWLETYFPESERPRMQAMVADAIEHGRTFEVETRVNRPDGSTGWAHSRAVPVRDDQDRVVEWFGAAMDISARKKAEITLQEREARLRAILRTAADAILTLGTDGIIRTVNPAAERLFGHASSAMLGRHLSLLIPELERPGVRSILPEAGTAEQSTPTAREMRGQRRDGGRFPVEVTVSRVNHTGLHMAIVRDLTERRQTEERLRDAERLSAIGTLAAGLGHDMNTILLPIRARLDAVESSGVPEDMHRQFEEIRRGVDYLQDLADGLHQLSRNPSSDPDSTVRATPLSLSDWWRHTGSLLRRAMPAHVHLTVAIDDDLPDVLVPPHALTQAILNLFVNAGKAVGENGRVTLWGRRLDDGRASIGVSDDGEGMSERVRRHAADPFFTTRRRGLGTGLGLALVRRVATQAGGEFEIESAPGEGTTVVLTLPAACSAPNDDARIESIASVAIEDPRLASLAMGVLEAVGFTVVDLLDLDADGVPPVALRLVDVGHLASATDDARTSSPPIILVGAARPDATLPSDIEVVPSQGSFDHFRTALQAAIERTLS